jgi:hypothetical protein
MKTKVTIIALLICLIGKSQITLEHTYPSVSQYMYISVVEFVKHGYKYMYFDNSKNARLYNLDHSLFKVIPLQVPVGYNLGGVLLSDSLFNTDPAIEVVYSYSGGTFPTFITHTKIIDENGAQIFALPQGTFPGFVNLGAANGGYKMIINVDSINKSTVKEVRVYSLVGGFPVHPTNQTGLKQSEVAGKVSGPMPNPSNGKTTIAYQLAPGQIVSTITVYDINGREIKNFQVDGSFNTLELDNSDLPSGTYFYQMTGSSEGRKMVIIK